ncbi:hypothetical protein JGU66_18455 [Myxococcaceae bacterium JPH2]|nr:hypothetical protein [Myxococcaceae bacterium JPH2]
MLRNLRVLLVFSLALSSVAMAQEEASASKLETHQSPTPFWLPRNVFIGTTFRNGAVTPQLRLQWEPTLFQDRHDAWVAILEGGVAWAASLPDTAVEGYDVPVSSYYEHTVQAGFGYRNHRDSGGLHWGFQVSGGPVFYGAHFTNVPADKRVAGIVSGRVQVGYQWDAVGLGVAVGYSEPFMLKRRSVARDFVGGPMVGFFADWR